MRNIDLDNITRAVIEHADPKVADPRHFEIYESLIRHLHDFVREVKLTSGELHAARGLINAIARPHQEMPDGETHMMTDLLGISELVELIHDQDRKGATETNLEGPLYVPDPPKRKMGECIGVDPDGDALFMEGRVLDEKGKPLANATVDVWQPDSKGFYDVQDPDQEPGNFRGLFVTDDEGRYAFETVVPLGYNVPASGPSGEVLRALGRHTWRPAHIHFKIHAPGHERLTTMVYVEGAKYIDSDTTFSVKKAIIDPQFRDSEADLKRRGLDKPFYEVSYDFVIRAAVHEKVAAE